MRIAVISPFVDRQHGTERAVAELIEGLSTQHNDQIELYAQRVSDVPVQSSPAKRQSQNGGIFWHRVPSIPGPHLLQFLGWLFLNYAARRPHKAVANPPDVVFSPGINALDADVVLVHAVFHRVAALQNSHRLGSLRLRHLHRKLYYLLLCRLERRVYSNPRVILAAVSRHTAVQLAEYFGRNDVNVIPNGVDADHFSIAAVASIREQSRQELRCSPQEFVLVFIGNDWRNKGLKILFEAVAACKDLPIRLLTVGQDHRAGFRQAAQNLAIADRVHFFAPVPDVRTFYAAADALVAPSLEDSFNLPVLEAMSCGLPVIVSSRAGISDWLSDAHDSIILKDPENASELVSAIRSLAVDLPLRKVIATNAPLTARKFSWDTHVSELRKLLLKAAGQKSRGAKDY